MNTTKEEEGKTSTTSTTATSTTTTTATYNQNNYNINVFVYNMFLKHFESQNGHGVLRTQTLSSANILIYACNKHRYPFGCTDHLAVSRVTRNNISRTTRVFVCVCVMGGWGLAHSPKLLPVQFTFTLTNCGHAQRTNVSFELLMSVCLQDHLLGVTPL